MKKKLLALVLALAMIVATVAGCGKGKDGGQTSSQGGDNGGATSEIGGTYDITVWVPELAVDLTKKQIADFNSSNEYGITFNATIEAVSEADSATTMITDVESGADIFFFAQDQSTRLIQSGALQKLGQGAAESVSSANASGVVAACKLGDDMYAYPLTADNGYFMYYDKSVIPEADVTSLEALIADCEKSGRTFCMETDTSAWYIASFFFGTGCVSEWAPDLSSVNDTFNSDKGLIAAKGLYKLQTSKAHVSSSQGTEFDAAVPAAVVVSGIWDYVNVENILGDNMGVAELPSFEVDGTKYHMGSFNGCKLLGVKPQTDAARSAALNQLAQYLVSESAQLERFDALAWGPANTNAQASDKVQANPGLVALNKQFPYSVPQGQIHGSWWDIAKVIGTDVGETDGSDAQLKAALQKYQDTISALFNMSTDEKEAFSVIGGICGTSWDTDFPMTRTTEPGDPTFYSEALELHAGETFKCRQGASWDVNFGDPNSGYPDGNAVVAEDGFYFVKLVTNADYTEGTVTLEKNSYVTGWTVIGTVSGTNWDTDFEMEIQADGTTFKSVDKFDMTAGTEFKVRQGHNWDVSYGNGTDNYVVDADGSYTVVFDSATGTITLE